MRENPVGLVERPRVSRREWAVLSPAEIQAVERSFRELAAEAEGEEQRWREQARVLFRAAVETGLRRGELLGLTWQDVSLTDPDGPFLRVARQWVRGHWQAPKSRSSARRIPLGPALADELFRHRARSRFRGDDERVFCHPSRGSALDHGRFAATLRLALTRAGIERPVRAFHDSRHTALTNAAAAGNAPLSIMALAGHGSFATTKTYIDLGRVAFRDEAEALEQRLLGTA